MAAEVVCPCCRNHIALGNDSETLVIDGEVKFECPYCLLGAGHQWNPCPRIEAGIVSVCRTVIRVVRL